MGGTLQMTRDRESRWNRQCHRKGTCGAATVALMLGAAWWLGAAAGPPEIPPPLPIHIEASDSVLLLSDGAAPSSQDAPHTMPGACGRLHFHVTCPLPEWSVMMEIQPASGPTTLLPADRFQIRGPLTTDPITPPGRPRVIATGHGPAPARDLELVIEVHPRWEDPPGRYTTTLHLWGTTPEAPTSAYPTERSPNEPPARIVGSGVAIAVEFEIPELTHVWLQHREYTVRSQGESGRYAVEPDVEFVVASNQPSCEVRLEGASFTSERDAIPRERVEWALIGDQPGEPAWHGLASDPVVLRLADGPGVVRARLRIAVNLTLADEAGHYRCQFTLVATPG